MKKPLHIVCLLLYRMIGVRLPFSFWPVFGRASSEIRRYLLIGMGCRIGSGCDIEPRIDVGFTPRLSIGKGSQINQNIILRTARIGDYVMLAPGVTILDRNHNFSRLDLPMALQGHSERQETVLEDDVWIGQNAIVMPGLRIETGAIVAAGSVVTHDVAAYDVVAGVPARVIKNRKTG